jgi:hypothetical protein
MNDSLRRLALGLDLPVQPGTPALIIDDVVLQPDEPDDRERDTVDMPATSIVNPADRTPGSGALPH